MKKYRLVLALLILLPAGCGVEPLQAPPFPTPEIWGIRLDPALDWMRPEINACTQDTGGISVIVREMADENQGFFSKEMDIAWSSTDSIWAYAYVLGWDELGIVVHEENPVQEIGLSALREIFSGGIDQWSEVSSGGNSLDGEIHAWVYAPEDSIQDLFENVLEMENIQNPFAFVAPNAGAMLQAVQEDPLAIGFLPMRWTAPGVKRVALPELGEDFMKKPILVFTPTQPASMEKDWLLCLMNRLEEAN